MRLLSSLLLSVTLLSSVLGQDFEGATVAKEKHGYQSDVSRLRNIVINSLYSHREVFLRELISNANDAIEKLRLSALTNKQVWDGTSPLNVSIKAVKDEDGKGGRLIISDTGIGMTPDELTRNLGTLAKSGTSEFLAKAENSDGVGSSNLIGAFGLGFYSSFLVADKVYVASIAPKSPSNPSPEQHVFSSDADSSEFEVFKDPRGNTLQRGTEITLVLKNDALEYLDTTKLAELITKHSSFSTAFPIYLWTEKTVEVPEDDVEEAAKELKEEATPEAIPKPVKTPGTDDEEPVIEEETTSPAEDGAEETAPKKMKSVQVTEWVQANPQPPLWMRDPKDVTDDEYKQFYQATFKDYTDPLAWYHFSGDSGTGTSFRAIIYVPSRLDESYWQNAAHINKDVRLMVKRVFITSDLGENFLPKWANWVKVLIDADDLPLNVSRETLQNTRFLKQLKTIILRRMITMFQRIEKDDPEKYAEIIKGFGGALKLGAIDDKRNSDKLVPLLRFASNQRNYTSLDEYLATKKQGQKQIFYLADMGKTAEQLSKSVFIEKLDARGYEVLLLNEPLDEIFVQTLRAYKKYTFQDVAKAGMKFGDEDSDPDSTPARLEELKEKFEPLLAFVKEHTFNVVREVVVSSRLVTSPCAILADNLGYTANMERMLNAQNKKQENSWMFDFGKRQRILELNPKSPLIQGLLRRVEQLPGPDEEKDPQAEEELKEVVSILVDGALVRSGFEVTDSHNFFTRVDRVLRRSLGVSETAATDAEVAPAPPIDPNVEEAEDDKPGIVLPDELKGKVDIQMEEVDENNNPINPIHDEL